MKKRKERPCSRNLKKGILFLFFILLLFPNNCSAATVIKNTGAVPKQTEIQKQTQQETEPEKQTATVRMVGDDLIHGVIYKTCAQQDGSYNFAPMFDFIRADIRSADLSIINQETIFVNNPALYSTYPCFGTPTAVGDAIADAGFDVVAGATNHTMDKGLTGVFDTLDFWNTAHPEISVLGIHSDPLSGDAAFRTVNGIKFGFVNYTYGLNGLEGRRYAAPYSVDLLSDPDVDDTVRFAAENSDITIAILHAGTEYSYTPDSYQLRQTQRMIDDGAKVVLCSHPHVVEPYGFVTTAAGNTGLVYYSLGNFISSQTALPRLLGGMADFDVVRDRDGVHVERYDFIPLVTVEGGNFYTTCKLDDYTDDIAFYQTLCAGATPAYFRNLWEQAALRY